MSMLDSFFNKGFKAARCKTLLKLTIPRIKLLRNRREIQIKQMRRDIAKLLETGQEATARIRVEHIIREEKMMAAQEIIELFCELISVRLPIIEAQRECPLDLKEAISSLCFAAPRCSDLTELMQVQMLFSGKYGREFVAAATELMPECGVNRQLVELLSVRAPDPDVKLKLLKEIAEEHELDWDATVSETELLKPHEDLLNGPTQFVGVSKLPLPEEKQDDLLYSDSAQSHNEPIDSDSGFEPSSYFPEVPNTLIRPSAGTVSAPEMLPFPASVLSDSDDELEKPSGSNKILSHEVPSEAERSLREDLVTKECESPDIAPGAVEDKQFLPFISSPSMSSTLYTVRQENPPRDSLLRTRTETDVDLQDVLAAAQAAAESAERAATAARTAATLAQVRITELINKKNVSSENPFHTEDTQNSLLDDNDGVANSPNLHEAQGKHLEKQVSNLPSYDDPDMKLDSTLSDNHVLGQKTAPHQPQRLPSIDDETYFSYPSLFASQDSNPLSRSHSFADNSSSAKEH